MCTFACEGMLGCPAELVGKLPSEADYVYVKFSGEDVF
jgi:hypothetical protein